MGVHGLWNLLEPVGKPVPLESLENKILAVDVSIWLHQATKGFRDPQGNPLPNAHLLGLCHRLCKLMFFKIKPVFVFDGGVPVLKRQTMALRNSRRDTVVKNNNAIAERILTNYIQSEVINKQLGKSNGKSGLPLLKKKKQEPDLFELPPIPQDMNEGASESDEDSDEFEDNRDLESVAFHIKGHNIHSVDFSSEAFRALPVETQHEILLELRDTRKQSSWNRIHQMPQEADDFSGFQMERLLKRRNLQQRLDEVVKEIGQKTQEEYALNKGDVVESLRIASDTSTRLVLIKKALQPATTPIEEISKEIVNIPLQTKLSDKSIAIDLETEVDLLEGSNEFSQQELFAILGSAKQKSNTEQNTQAPSSSDDDSDFEEVPSHAAVTGKQIILDIPINPTLINEEEDDMFADVFGPLAQSKEEKISNQIDIEKSPLKVSSNHEILDREERQVDFVEEIKIGHPASLNNKSPRDAILLNDEKSLCGDDFTANRSSTSSPDTLESHFTVVADKSEEFQPTEVIQCHSSASEGVSHQESTFVDNGIATSNIENVALVTNVEKSIKTEETRDQMDLKVDDEILIDISDDGTSPLVRAVQPSTSIKFNQPKEMSTERKEELEELDRIINREQSALIQQHGKQERIASSITDQMYIESQQLLRLFGIPYLVAPMEAEAQCAFLDEAGLTQGTITDDSDIWLFGGRRVYKNFFNQGKYVQFFEAEDIHRVFKLGREKLVHLALLTGSDYTEGIQGVGPVGALEILAEFPNEGLEALEQFRDWLQKVQAKKNAPPENKIRQKIRNLQIRPG